MSNSAHASSKSPPKKCQLDENHCVSLQDILISFSAPISEEHAWALCYQCAKCFVNAVKTDPARCTVVTDLSQVLIHRDGHVHANTIFKGGGIRDDTADGGIGPSEQSVVAGLGLVVFKALDFGMDEDEERHLSPELTRLIQLMTASADDERQHPTEYDDEGIERDSGEIDEDSSHLTSLSLVLRDCTVHLGCGGAQEADSHYRAVCRALVAEALELSTFLENVGTGQLRKETTDHLNFSEWARLWMQVVRELRRGVQLKKVCYTRKPIEFELTPYEILMEDIRSRRYKLNKVMVDGNIPYNVKKDAHAVILEFIRSRPPLRKASERKLNPPRTAVEQTPREKLLESIKQGQIRLKPSPVHRSHIEDRLEIRRKRIIVEDSRLGQEVPENGLNAGGDSKLPRRRLIKIDSAFMTEDTDDDDEVEDIKEETTTDGNPWQRTGSLVLSEAEIQHYCDTTLECRPTSPKLNKSQQCCIL